MNEDRQKIWDEYKGAKNGPMRRMFLDYNRYFEAGAIEDALESMHVDFSTIKVLDYGCGVADYGIYFARLGSYVRLLDIDSDALNFAIHRFKLEHFSFGITDTITGYDLVIFGEVLDHLDSPYDVLQQAINGGARFIFTSSYPFRSDDPNDVHWKHDHHPESAFKQQKACRELLESHYNKLNFGGQRNLWTRKI